MGVTNQGRKYKSNIGIGSIVIAISMLLLFVQKSYADEFDDFMTEMAPIIERELRMEKETIQPTYKPGCDSLDRAYQIVVQWTGTSWLASQIYCDDAHPCAWLLGKDPKKYCKDRN